MRAERRALLLTCISVLRASLVCRHPTLCKRNRRLGDDRKVEELYLYTLRYSLTGTLMATPAEAGHGCGEFNATNRANGDDWPLYAATMTGVKAMDLLHELLHDVFLTKRIEGDFLEAGVWRGGSSIYARGFMEVYNIFHSVWVADSFRGFAQPQNSADKELMQDFAIHGPLPHCFLSVRRAQVEDNFMQYQLLDSSVKFVEGFFGDTLPNVRLQVGMLAILRVDSDMYQSTLETLCFLYDKLACGGYWIMDDWNIPQSRAAGTDFMNFHRINDRRIDVAGAHVIAFEKLRAVSVNTEWCHSRLYAAR